MSQKDEWQEIKKLPRNIVKTFKSATEKNPALRLTGQFIYVAGTVGIVAGLATITYGGSLAIGSAFGAATLSSAGTFAFKGLLLSMASGRTANFGRYLAKMTNHC